MKKSDFINNVRQELSIHDFKLQIVNTNSVNADGLRLGGYFDYDDKILKVARKLEDSFETIVHEFCHFNQYIENCECFQYYKKNVGYWNDWLRKEKNLSKKNIEKEFIGIKNLELDCEKRVIKMVKKYDLPIDIDDYVQGANAYLFSYTFAKENRLWPKYLPYIFIKKMPNKFLAINAYNKLSEEHNELFKKYCF